MAHRELTRLALVPTREPVPDTPPPVAVPPTRGAGRPLPSSFRGAMERSFGADFGGVRVHTDARAHAVNRSLRARAFTRGQDLFFRQGQYEPGSTAGRELIAHELTHVVQQRAGRVPSPQGQGAGADGAKLSIDPALEAEADAAGARAARGEAAGPVTAGPGGSGGDGGNGGDGADGPSATAAVVQPKLGLELEMLVLTDIAGRPAPEKVELGTYGNLDLVVDRSGTLVGQTQARAALAPYRRVDLPEKPPLKGSKQIGLGAYDLPTNYRSRRKPAKGPDPRPVRHALTTLAERKVEQPVWQQRVLNQWITEYVRHADNWEQDLALASLKKIRVLGGKLLRKFPDLADIVQPMLDEAAKHELRWRSSALKAENIESLMREVGPKDQDVWSPVHPVAEGLTGEGYDSIVEIVTKAYDPETEQGSKALLADMADAAELAGRIEAATGQFAARVPLASISGVTAKARSAFVGNDKPTTVPQRTDASVQATMAVELKEMQGFFLAGMGGFQRGGFGPREFALKHQSGIDVEQEVGRQAPNVATKVLYDLPREDFVPNDLLGLFTLVAQYLLMGAVFESPGNPQLDKNAVALLSRTDLAKVYRQNVSEREKRWVTPHLDLVKDSLLRHTRRDAGHLLLTPESYPPLPHVTRTLKCGPFIDNVFTQPSDGFTPHLDEGIFKQMGPERIPDGPGKGQKDRTAPVFEMRNMIPRAGDRFARNQWVPLATDLVTLLTRLNTRGFWG